MTTPSPAPPPPPHGFLPHGHHPAFVLNEHGRILLSNTGAQRLTGLSAEALQEALFLDRLIPPHAQEMVANLLLRLADGEPCRSIHGLRHISGATRMVAWRYTPLEEESPPRFLAQGIDMSSRLGEASPPPADHLESAHETLMQLLSRSVQADSLTTILEQALWVLLSTVPWLRRVGRGAIFLLDKSDGGELHLAAHHGFRAPEEPPCATVPMGECLCGISARDACILFTNHLDDPIHTVRHSEALGPHGHYCIPIVTHGACVLGVLNIYLPEGHARDAQDEAFLQAFASILAALILRFQSEEKLRSAMDVTDSLNTELSRIILRYQDASSQLQESENRFHNLTRSLPDGIITTDSRGGITFWNDGAQKIFGYREEEVLGKPLTLLIPARFHAKHLQGMARLGEDQEFWSSDGVKELIGKRKDGVEIPLEMTASLWSVGGERNYAAMVRDVSERKRSQEEIYYRTHFDSLTGLPNRNLFLDRLRQALKIAARTHGKVALVMLDLDQFKKINDSLGTENGDRYISEMAMRAKGCLRESDSLCRVGGDEYAAILGSVEAVEDVAKVVGKLLAAIATPIHLGEQEIYPTASAGIALFPDDGAESAAMMQNAETALRRAREAGRGMFQFYTSAMDIQAARRLALETRMRKALELGEFVLFYQPKVATHSGAVDGMEALVRWRKPEGGMVSPGEFIPVAEESGLIVPMGEWIMRAACMQAKAWLDGGVGALRVAVNLSTLQFQDQELIAKIQGILEETGLPAHLLELEITESMVMKEVDQAIVVLERLRDMGIHIAVDDFGTGYSSLNYLKRFPIHTLKVDQSFVREMKPGSDDAAIVAAIIALAHHLNLTVVAEGVETQEQMNFLAEHHCDEIQGYLLGRPMPAEEFVAYLHKRRG